MESLTFFHTWLPFIYLYGVGGIAFLIGMFLIVKTKALIYKNPIIKNGSWYLFLDLFTMPPFMGFL